MVRRRTRTPKVAVGNGCLLEDQYIASPKRKDCKLESGVSEIDVTSITDPHPNVDTKSGVRTKVFSYKNKSEQSGDYGSETIDVPLATRSQTRTIDSFFKVHGKKTAKTTKFKVSEDNNLYDSVLSQSAQCFFDLQLKSVVKQHDDTTLQISRAPMLHSHELHMPHGDVIFGFVENSTTDNIFLQEPVLTLNIDKTPNQASSITIKKSIETEPVFSSPPLLGSSASFNGCLNQIISLDAFSFASKPILLPDTDSSSCDSGIAVATSLDNNNSSFIEYTSGAQARRRKPATPHRIVCPSPIKSSPRALVDGTGGLSPSGRAITAPKELLSPRKSQRHVAPVASKTRRRLNQPEDKAPYLINKKTTIRDTCKQDDFSNDSDERGYDENLKSLVTGGPIVQHVCRDLKKNVSAFTKGQPKSKSSVVKVHQPKSKNKSSLPLATTNCNRELTEFFPVRRSVRKTKTAVKEEMMKNLEQAILEERAEGLKVAHFEGKGWGIVADRKFLRGEFVVEYVGDLISMSEASEREKQYALDENAGCYMYYFKHKNIQYCIDATVDTGKLGRLVNHSRNGNLITKTVVVKQRPHLVLIAKDDIEAGEELTYDYGDRSKESLLHHPWLAF